MEINLFDNYLKDINFDYQKIIKDVEEYFKENNTISVVLVNNDEIKLLNKQYRGIDSITDVLSFPEESDDYLGEVFININRVYEQAIEYSHSNEREFAFLLIHGILHLKGYDHETKADEELMFNKQNEILNELGYRRDNEK